MSKDANSFGHDKALAWERRGFVYTKKRMHRFDTPSRIEFFIQSIIFLFVYFQLNYAVTINFILY